MASYAFRTTPMRHQYRALKKVVTNRGVAGLLMDPGTGKSKVVVDYLGMLWEKYGTQDWLITAPLSALDGWPDQFEQHLPEHIPLELVNLGDGWRNPGPCLCTKRNGDPAPSCRHSVEERAAFIKTLADDRHTHGTLRVVLLNHDAFGGKKRPAHGRDGRKLATVTVWDRLLDAIERWAPDGDVIDESHRFKTHTSQRSQAGKRMARFIPKRLILTGTVAPRNLLDVFGQWLHLNPSRFGDDWNAFRFKYAKWGGYHDKEPILWLETDDMRERILADAFVIKKEDALDLEPVTEIVVPVRLSDKEADAYVSMGESMLVELPSGNEALAPIPLTKLLRQRQLTGGFVGFEGEEGERVEERLGDSKARVCVDKLRDLVDAGEKVVVFAHFRPDLDILEERVMDTFNPRITRGKRKGQRPVKVPVYRIDGSTKKVDRMAYRTGFRDHEGPAVFLAQMRTMSLGVNELVVAAYGIVYSMSERRDDFDQAIDRLDRQGQTRPVTIYHLVVPDSVDELILMGHRDKLDLERVITTRDEARKYLTLGRES